MFRISRSNVILQQKENVDFAYGDFAYGVPNNYQETLPELKSEIRALLIDRESPWNAEKLLIN